MSYPIGATNFSRPTNELESIIGVTTKSTADISNISQLKTYLQEESIPYNNLGDSIINWHTPGDYKNLSGRRMRIQDNVGGYVCTTDLALFYAMSSDKPKYLESIQSKDAIADSPILVNNPSFRHELYSPAEGYLSYLYNINDVLYSIMRPDGDTPLTYQKNYKWVTEKCYGYDVLTILCKDNCYYLCWYNASSDFRGHEVYAFRAKSDMQDSLKTISTDICTKIAKCNEEQGSLTIQNYFSYIYSIDTAIKGFKVNIFCKPENIAALIDSSKYLGVPEDCFHDVYRNEKIPRQSNYDILDQFYTGENLKVRLEMTLSYNKQHAITPIVNAILKKNSTLKPEYQTNLTNIPMLHYAFKQGYTDTIKSFAISIVTSYLSLKDKGEILAVIIDNDRYSNGFSIAMEKNETEAILGYLATIFNHCKAGDDLYSILETINKMIDSSPQSKALYYNRYCFFTKYTKMILAEEKLNDEQKTLLLLGQNKKGSQTLDIAINNNRHDMAIFFIDAVIKSDLKDSLKMSLLSSKILDYGYNASLAEILNSGKAKVLFITIKDILAKKNISNKDKIEILCKKSDKNVSFLTKLFG